MERFSSRDNDVLVDCSTPQKATFGHSFSSRNLPRNSDIDFNDVFGGPPRRSSIQEPRHSFSEAADPYRNRVSDEIPLYGDPWAGEHEKPVFGGENMSRKRFVSEEFFDDIFRGNESANSTPRKHDRDVFSSSPGSRVLSPARPLPPRAEPLLNSSVPSQFSLPVKMSKPMDLPMSGSGALKPHKHKDGSLNGASHLHSPKVSVLGFPNGAIQAQDESKYAIHSSYRRSPLSHEFSLRGEESFDKGTDGQQDLVSNVPFHFSIYKWASKGIPMVMPLRRVNSSKSKQKGKSETSNLNDQTESQNGITQSALPSMETVTVGPSSLRSDVPKTVSSGVEPGKFENDMLKKSSSRVEVESCHVVEEASIQKQKQDNYENDHYEAVSCNVREETKVSSLSQYENDHYEAVPCNVREETKVSSLPWVGMSQTTEKEIWRQTEKASKPALKTLHSLLSEQDDEQAKRENGIRRKMEGNVTKPRIAEQSLAHDDTGIGVKNKEGIHGLNSERAMKVTSQGLSRNSQDGTDRRIENGKVKEFIKIFNQEAPLKPKVEVRQNKSFRWSERGVKEDYQWNHANKELHGQESMSNVKTSDAIPSNPTPDIRQFHEKPESTQSATPASSVLFSDGSQKNSSASSTESAPDDARATAIEEDESFSGRFLVKELGQDEDKQREQSDIDVEDIQVIDAKIRQWSHGKEGNIRSLLSTLQYVLWPRTGWKPVPLVDIVEGPAVKRAYQKALLCLHPDKLQQKGAASHQKYTAERVFDILQESWTHFNSLGSL